MALVRQATLVISPHAPSKSGETVVKASVLEQLGSGIRAEAVEALSVVEATEEASLTVTIKDFSRQHLGIGATTICNIGVNDLCRPSTTLISSKPRTHEHPPPNAQDRDRSSIVRLESAVDDLWSLLKNTQRACNSPLSSHLSIRARYQFHTDKGKCLVFSAAHPSPPAAPLMEEACLWNC